MRWIHTGRPLHSVENMDHAALFTMMTALPLTASLIVAANAKKLNAAWRERRAARTRG